MKPMACKLSDSGDGLIPLILRHRHKEFQDRGVPGVTKTACGATQREFDKTRAIPDCYGTVLTQPKLTWRSTWQYGGPNASADAGAGANSEVPLRPLSRPSPSANLVGNWKGDLQVPCIRRVPRFPLIQLACFCSDPDRVEDKRCSEGMA